MNNLLLCVNAVTKSLFWHLKSIAKMRNLVSKPYLEKIIHAFIRVDNSNAYLIGLPVRPLDSWKSFKMPLVKYYETPGRENTYLQFLDPLTAYQLDIELMLRPYLLSINHSMVWAQNIVQICLLSRWIGLSAGTGQLVVRVQTKCGVTVFSNCATHYCNQLP